MPTKFTDRYVKSLKPKDHAYDLREGEGFGIRVLPSGAKSWFFLYHFDGRKKRLTLGHYPSMPLAQAHQKHREALKMLEEHVDPGAALRTAKRERREAHTVAELVDDYLEKWAKPRKRTWQEDKRQLEKDVEPRWGKRKAREVTRRDVRELLEDVTGRGSPIAANRLLACVRRMFNWAVEQDILESAPCTGIRAPAKERRKERVLSAEEIRVFWSILDRTLHESKRLRVPYVGMEDSTRRALKLILVTAQRPGEVAGAHWSEFSDGWWTIPTERAKNENAHRVPLSNLAQDVLGAPGDGYVFPSPRKSVSHVHPQALSHAVKRMFSETQDDLKGVEPFTPHDLRRTAASHMTGAGVPRLTVQKILNHAEPGVTAVYDRHSYDVEKKQALDDWARKLRNIILGDREEKVVPFVRRERKSGSR